MNGGQGVDVGTMGASVVEPIVAAVRDNLPQVALFVAGFLLLRWVDRMLTRREKAARLAGQRVRRAERAALRERSSAYAIRRDDARGGTGARLVRDRAAYESASARGRARMDRASGG